MKNQILTLKILKDILKDKAHLLNISKEEANSKGINTKKINKQEIKILLRTAPF